MPRSHAVMAVTILAAVLVAGACRAEEVTTFAVGGKVLMPEGSPAAGALVEARSISRRTDWEVKATATSGADGAFTMRLEGGSYRVCAVCGEFVYFNESQMIDVSKDSPSRPIELRLEKGCRVQGSVVDTSTGQPVAGVKIITRDGDHAESSDAGEWTMTLRRKNHAITAIREGYWWPIVNFSCSGDTLAVKVETKPGGTVKGRVVDEEGKPIADARVATETSGYFRQHSARTDAEGRFILAGQDPDSRVAISVGADGYDSSREQPVTFPAGQREAEVEFKLTKVKVRTITGRVTREDGSPVEGVKVAYGHGASYWDYVTAKTDKDGNYAIKDARIAECVVVASGPGLAPQYKIAEADKDLQLDFQMKSGHTVEGCVEDEDGNPIQGVHLSVSMEVDWKELSGNLYRTISETTTDKDGRFSLRRLPEGFVYVDAYARGFDGLENERLKVDRKDYVLVLRKTVPGQICGTVLRESDGKPVPDFNIRLDFSRKGGSSSGLSPGLHEQGVSFQSADGRFSIKGLKVGDGYAVVATAPGYLEARLDPATVQPVSSSDDKGVVVKLRPASAFEGAVVEAGTGKPLEGVTVTAWNTEPFGSNTSLRWDMSGTALTSVSARTDAAGKFRFESMPFTSGAVMLEKQGFARTIVRGVRFSQPLEASLEKGATVTGTVADKQGDVPPGVRLNVEQVDLNLSFHAQINPDGCFEIADLPAGEYRILEYRQGQSRAARHQSFDLSPGAAFRLDWAKEGPVVVEGKVLQAGKPVAKAYVSVNSRKKGMNWVGSADSSDDGSFRLTLMKPGSYSFLCMLGEWTDPNKIDVHKTLQLVEGINRVDFNLPCGSISGKLLDKATGKPIANASVRLFLRETYEQKMGRANLHWWETGPQWWPENECKTDKNGAFEVKNLKAGKWLICLRPGESRGIPVAVAQLEEGEARSGVVAKVPAAGSAKITVAGKKSCPKGVMIVCVDECGLVHYPKYEDGAYVPDFEELPAGKTKAVVVSHDYLPTEVPFRVQPNETANVSVKLTKGPRIVFKAKSESGEVSDPVSVAVRITSPDGKPVLKGPEGPRWGEIIAQDRGYAAPLSMTVKPGRYLVKASVRDSSDEWRDETDLTGYSGTIEVCAGKDTVIEVESER